MIRFLPLAVLTVLPWTWCVWASGASVSGRLTDPQNRPVPGATLRLITAAKTTAAEATSSPDGRFTFPTIPPGSYTLRAAAAGFADVSQPLSVGDGQTVQADLRFSHVGPRVETVTVSADVTVQDIQRPDPAQRINIREDVLDANPGRPGAPVSLPGLPIESASGGIKAPQYFSPGVAGDHGEPIAQFLLVGSFLVPNNLSANAHGNGYSDPNLMVPAIIEGVQTDGGAFNVLEGNHSVNLATVYGFRERLEPFVTLTGDYRDLDLASGWSPGDPAVRSWIAVEAAFGNGFLDRLEHRQQYKLNGFRVFDIGSQQVTLFGAGYYGQSRIPGLAPIDVPNLGDTIDSRQRDQTHTGEVAANDVWKLAPSSELQLSSFFRTYNLSLYSNFGDGLIRQSEFRTVAGGNATWLRRFRQSFSIMAGMDYLREAPRRLDLDHYASTDPAVYGAFQKVTASNVTMNLLTPFLAIDGHPRRWLYFNLGWRRDQIDFANNDLLHAANSYQRWVGVNSPKATIRLDPPENAPLPAVAFSFGQAFFTNDPRIGNGTALASPVSRAHAYQVVLSKTIWATDFRATLGRVTQEQSLAKIDPDTGLQFDEGPSRNRYLTLSARHYFGRGLIQGSVSKADARDLSDGTPVPEAPRLIFDVLGTLDRLPLGVRVRAEFEDVGRKPLGDGFVSVPVREFRGALARQFGNRLQVGINFLIASGYTGQTTEILALAGEDEPSERVVGVYLPSYVTLSFTYRFGRMRRP